MTGGTRAALIFLCVAAQLVLMVAVFTMYGAEATAGCLLVAAVIYVPKLARVIDHD